LKKLARFVKKQARIWSSEEEPSISKTKKGRTHLGADMCSNENNFISTWEGFLMASLKDQKVTLRAQRSYHTFRGNKIKVGAWWKA